MANIPLKTLTFPGLDDIYTVPQISPDLATAGAAADSAETGRQIGLLKADLGDVSADITNIIGGTEPANYEEGKNLDASGNTIASTGYNVSDFIPYTWTGNSRYYVGDNTQQTYRLCFYDENKAFIQGYIAPGNVGGDPFRYINVATQVTGGTCAYVRFSFKGTEGKITSSDGNTDIWLASSASTSGGIIGDLNDLNVTNKENLVGAINSTLTEIDKTNDSISNITTPKKNLFDKDNANIIVGYILTSTQKYTTLAGGRVIWIPCKPNTTYTISKTAGTRFVVSYGSEEPAIGASVENFTSYGTAQSITITTSATARYLGAWVWNSGTDANISAEDMIASVMIEEGATATQYEPYTLTACDATAREEAEGNSERLSAMSRQVVINSTRQQATFGEEMISDFSALTPNGSETYADGTWNVPNGGGLSTTLNVTANTMYFIQMTVSSAPISDGSSNYRVNPLEVSLGDDNISIYADFDANWKVCLVPSTSGEVTLSLQCAPVLSLQLTSLSVKPVINLPVAPLVANSMQFYAANNLNGNSVAYGGGQSKRLSSSPNTAFGYRAQLELDTAIENTALGYNAQRYIRNGRANTGIGNCSQQHLTTGMYNNAIGTVAQGGGQEGFTGCWNNALGNEAQRDITTGCNNVGIGRRAQSYITSGNMNVAIGAFSGFATVGHQDGSWGTKTSDFQTLVGGETTQASTSDADYLIAIGYRAKGNEKGIALGALSSALGEKSIAIGYGVTASADNQIVIGEDGDSVVLCGKRITFNADHTVTWEDVT